MDAGEDGRRHQVRVGVRAGHPVFDAGILAAGDRQAQGDDAMVVSPVRGQGDERVGLQAPVGVGVGGEDGHGLGHGLLQAADGVFQSGGNSRSRGGFGVGEDIIALFVQQADMDMQAAAGVLDKRLRHEGRAQAVFERRPLDDALEHGAVVAGA